MPGSVGSGPLRLPEGFLQCFSFIRLFHIVVSIDIALPVILIGVFLPASPDQQHRSCRNNRDNHHDDRNQQAERELQPGGFRLY